MRDNREPVCDRSSIEDGPSTLRYARESGTLALKPIQISYHVSVKSFLTPCSLPQPRHRPGAINRVSSTRIIGAEAAAGTHSRRTWENPLRRSSSGCEAFHSTGSLEILTWRRIQVLRTGWTRFGQRNSFDEYGAALRTYETVNEMASPTGTYSNRF